MSKHQEWQQEERLFLHLGNERDTSGSGKRYFSRGGVKYALLELLQQENMHGYQMMKALEDQSGGTYKPSAGSIYPTLQMLRDQGFVEAYKENGKKIFQITDEGRQYLQEEQERPEAAEPAEQGWEQREQNEDAPPPEEGVRRNRRLTPAGKELLHLLKAAERAALTDAGKAAQLRVILAGLRESLQTLVVDPAAAAEEQLSAQRKEEVAVNPAAEEGSGIAQNAADAPADHAGGQREARHVAASAATIGGGGE